MSSSPTVVIFTSSYPYELGAESTFIEPELRYLTSECGRIIVVPEKLGGAKNEVPTGVSVEEGYGASGHDPGRILQTVCLALGSLLFWRELGRRWKTLFQPQALLRLIRTVGAALYTHDWLVGFIAEKSIDLESTLFYTYWLDHITLGIGLLKDDYPRIKLISRAHGADVYEHRRRPPYFPCRSEYLKRLDRLFVVSNDGCRHISEQYPQFAHSYEVARLGVKDPKVMTGSSEDGIFRVVSCSSVIPVKRLDLLAEGIERLALSRPDQSFEWTHIGGGRGLKSLDISVRRFPANVKCRFLGHVPTEEVLAYYRDNPVDVFINVSRSEGIPVSIMEAESCGIPVVASAVGGLPEIVTEKNGRLLGSNPTAHEIAEAIWSIVSDPELAGKKRAASRLLWKERYNTDVNSAEFARHIRSLIDVPDRCLLERELP